MELPYQRSKQGLVFKFCQHFTDGSPVIELKQKVGHGGLACA
jgi:hypothetical protein